MTRIDDYDLSWLNEQLWISPQLIHILKLNPGYGGPKRFQVLDAVAKELGVKDTSRLCQESNFLLENCVSAIEEVLQEDPGTWANDIETGRAAQLAHSAVQGLLTDDLICILGDFGGSRDQVKADVREVKTVLSELLQRRLAERSRKMLDRWRSDGRWRSGLRLGILT